MPRDPVKALERQRRHRARKHAERFGPNAGDMRGRHGNHARGEKNGKWNSGRLITSHGYVAVRVDRDHPHAWGHGRTRYAYEHILLMERHLSRQLRQGEVVHHRNGNKADNRIENLELTTAQAHMREHIEHRTRDAKGRLVPEDLRVQQFPEVRHG